MPMVPLHVKGSEILDGDKIAWVTVNGLSYGEVLSVVEEIEKTDDLGHEYGVTILLGKFWGCQCEDKWSSKPTYEMLNDATVLVIERK